MTTYLLAGGGTAGHVNPLLAVADVLREREPDAGIIVLGTREGLEARLVPERGYELTTIAKVPFPRRPNRAALAFPATFLGAVRDVRRVIDDRDVDVVVGFGGYAATPAYVAARGRVPVVIHEANAMPGMANKLGAKWASRIGTAFTQTPLPGAQFVGMPLRREIELLDRAARRSEAIDAFGLDPDRPTLLVTGGSLGAKQLNETMRVSGTRIVEAGWQLLHIVGRLSAFDDPGIGHYHVVEYCDRMDLAFSAADLVVCRSGSSTVSEITAVGLPAVYVPYPAGNGEQAVNIREHVATGAARTVRDADFTPGWVEVELLPLLGDRATLERMGAVASRIGVRDGAARVVRLVDHALGRAA
ncbi:UDP-N-acetylglucosamine--N-acetylmuramyl-(pentapeptide) pyrophosphoryl-undecaprenol N-acetylglucosamine transferase [Pseudoclavibacter endophyticus]|uniref:UDP-N-acetylglucosamine--N-acetylmuramyl-(pentapeptide) pyrophosphoryl-undecaprenol N-acetylglucosamine transferase n=1 Tax=Pseudoclavibacter endophyticus TaxID=1778590 RepID=A0A6H9WVQ9_9MICO|nr:UDP-N-acetylglucosamine--N-acetylmuramyl-(pentapeptide) pyrophosphoryl-undecaprenol N-acetylglucosamine transferase [Pseudoclavibacter endophyticus]KAB1650250.1 UDP-N-acetylglucosamine--N-acetylmuramyl-(pentapeptide) pyrophosphoryl-undecaprenol N-acetylglucosamine transferase [Pseudoclavibacter endophyticus]GGA55824.1 UDP-N-acetylglucosamine--N-acetylmuramyl-(pentapeptide) pyrophosphoryl-undecaprenol N-acetylglucosamine transferase [Pseudoclavibacter endophyticus]